MPVNASAPNEKVIERFERGLILCQGNFFIKTHDFGCGNYEAVILPLFQLLEVGKSPLELVEDVNQMRAVRSNDDSRRVIDLSYSGDNSARGYKSASFVLLPDIEFPKMPELGGWRGLLRNLKAGEYGGSSQLEQFNVSLKYLGGMRAIAKGVSSVQREMLNDLFGNWMNNAEFKGYLTFHSGEINPREPYLIGKTRQGRCVVPDLATLASKDIESLR